MPNCPGSERIQADVYGRLLIFVFLRINLIIPSLGRGCCPFRHSVDVFFLQTSLRCSPLHILHWRKCITCIFKPGKYRNPLWHNPVRCCFLLPLWSTPKVVPTNCCPKGGQQRVNKEGGTSGNQCPQHTPWNNDYWWKVIEILILLFFF